ncbi:hypothetical protein HNV12_12430 [Methanococcoides sp. SA1]|nr:hypothetical protein [Methanococcoides sp. SA1]
MPAKTKRISRVSCLAVLITAVALLTGCTGQKTVNFKINSVPKGAHVLYQVVGGDIPCQGQWVYLGNTPVQGVRQFEESQLEGAKKITLKIMHTGYHEQVKEWDGPGFWQEVEEREVIFWTPELIVSE